MNYYPAAELSTRNFDTPRAALKAAGAPARQARRAVLHAKEVGAPAVGVKVGQHWRAALPVGSRWSAWLVLGQPCSTEDEARRIAESVVTAHGGRRGAVRADPIE